MDKKLVYLGLFIGSGAGSWLGSLLDHGNFFGIWSLLLGGVGGILGIFATYKFSNT